MEQDTKDVGSFQKTVRVFAVLAAIVTVVAGLFNYYTPAFWSELLLTLGGLSWIFLAGLSDTFRRDWKWDVAIVVGAAIAFGFPTRFCTSMVPVVGLGMILFLRLAQRAYDWKERR